MYKQFEKVAVEVKDKRKINILAAIRNQKIIELMTELINAAWEIELEAGRVNNAMIAASPEVV